MQINRQSYSLTLKRVKQTTPDADDKSSAESCEAKKFAFETVYGPENTQTEVYNQSAAAIVDAVLQGYNMVLI